MLHLPLFVRKSIFIFLYTSTRFIPDSAKILAIGEDLKAPNAVLIAVFCIEINFSTVLLHIDEYAPYLYSSFGLVKMMYSSNNVFLLAPNVYPKCVSINLASSGTIFLHSVYVVSTISFYLWLLIESVVLPHILYYCILTNYELTLDNFAFCIYA